MARLVILFAILLAPLSARADPISAMLALSEIIGMAAAAFVVSYGGYIAMGAFMLYRSSSARRKQKAAAAKARADAIAALEDRTANVISSEAPWQIVYGNPAPCGGTVVGVFESGGSAEYKHIVMIFAAHEIDAFENFYIEGIEVTLDGNGWSNNGEWIDIGETKTVGETFAIYAADQIVTVAHEPTSNYVVGQISTFTFYGGGGEADPYTVAFPVKYLGNRQFQQQRMENGVYAFGTDDGVNYMPLGYTYQDRTPRVHISAHLGAGIDTADAFLKGQVPSKWTDAHKLSGYAYVVLTVDLNHQRFQGGPPAFTARMRGKKMYDPRTGTTIYSRNPAVCLMDFLMSSYGFKSKLAQIDQSSFIAAANACDVEVYAANDAGSKRRYLCDGAFFSDSDRETTLQALEDSFAANSHRSGGVWRVTPGTWTTPIKTLDTATASAAPIQVKQSAYSAKERYNVARGTFFDRDDKGASKDYVPYKNTTWLAADGAEFPMSVNFNFTSSNQRCRDLARIQVERSRGGMIVEFPAHLGSWPLQPGDRVWLTDEMFGFANKTMRITDWVYSPKAPITLELLEDVPSFYDLADEIALDPAPNTNLANPFQRPTAPSGVVIESGTTILKRNSDGTIVSRTKVSWDLATDTLVTGYGGNVIIKVRNNGLPGSAWEQIVVVQGDATSYYFENLEDGVQYVFAVSFRNGYGTTSFDTMQMHIQVGKMEPPTQPGSISITQDRVFIQTVSDADLAGYRIRSLPGNLAHEVTSADWSLGTDAHTGLVTEFPWLFTSRLYGIQTIMVVSEDTSGNQSAPVAASLDFGIPNTNNIAQTMNYRTLGWPNTTNGYVSSGDLYAPIDPAIDFYQRMGSDFYSAPDDFYGADSWLGLSWVSSAFAVLYGGGQLVLDYAASGRNVTVEYALDGAAYGDFYTNSTGDFYQNASGDFYGGFSAWTPWPGSLAAIKGARYLFRVLTEAGSPQGIITKFIAQLAMERVRQEFGVTAISSGGTRLAPSAGFPARNWISIDTVVLTPTVDGSGAVSGRVIDFSAALGPQVQLVNSSGTAVTGAATAQLGGIADAGP